MQIRITKSRAALAALFVLAGVGLSSLLSPLVGTALATAGQIVNVSDRSGSAYFAKVSSDGKLAVGDGAGPLSVDGTVTDRPGAPALPWSKRMDIQQASKVPIAGPSSVPINLTSLSFSTVASTGNNLGVFLYGAHVASSATSCSGAIVDAVLWGIGDLGDGATPVSFTFSTPLQWKPPANTKGCLTVSGPSTTDLTMMNAVGFYGG
jgi:hypothetical protein